MRISDWSSDVCSSDLIGGSQPGGELGEHMEGADKVDLDRLAINVERVRRIVPADRLHRGRDPCAVNENAGCAMRRFSRIQSRRDARIVGNIGHAEDAADFGSRCLSGFFIEVEDRNLGAVGCEHFRRRIRSEEHTSELQSLMRNSYAVFCLKKKTRSKHNNYINLCNYIYYDTR